MLGYAVRNHYHFLLSIMINQLTKKESSYPRNLPDAHRACKRKQHSVGDVKNHSGDDIHQLRKQVGPFLPPVRLWVFCPHLIFILLT